MASTRQKLVSVLVLGSLVSSAYAWTDASINYYQPIAAYDEGVHQNNSDDSKEFQDIMLNDKFYALLLEENLHASKHAGTVEFVMLMREMHRINHNLELILEAMTQKGKMKNESI